MFREVRHYAGIFRCYIKQSIQAQLEYPSFLICWAIGIPLQFFLGLWMIVTITTTLHPLNHWGFNQIIFLYGLSLISQGIMVTFFINTWQVERMVVYGEFDRFFLYPINVFFQYSFTSFNMVGLLDMMPGVIIFIYGCVMTGFQCSLLNFLKLALVLLGATLIRAAYFSITGSIAFWTKSSNSLIGTGQALLEKTTMYPLSIYPYLVQVLFTFILPFAFVSFYPAADFLNNRGNFMLPFGYALATPLVGILCTAVTVAVFYLGLRRYESSGC